MDTEAFSQQLTAFYDRLRTLSQTLEHRATALELPLDKLMEDLSTALEELRVADETLRQQHQALAEAHYTIATERQRYHTNEALLVRYHLLSEHARDIVLFIRLDGQIVEANQAAVDAYGYDRTTLLTMTIYDLRATATVPLVASQMTQADQHGILFETVHQRQDGSLFPVEVNSIGAEIGGERLLLSIIRDITARAQMERNLAQSQRRLQALFDHALDGILLADDTAGYVDANPAACMLTGYDRAELLQQSVWDLTPEMDQERGRALWQHFLATGTQQGEYTLQRKDGTSVEVEYRATAHIVPGLHLTVLRDISWRKRAERALQQANAALEQRVQERTAALAATNEALRQEMAEHQHAEEERRRLEREAQRVQHFALLGRLAAGVSHEIRNPLAAVFLHVDLLEEEFRQPSSDSAVQIAESLTDIKRNLVRLEDLVQDYLSLVRVTTIQRAPEDLGALVLTFAREMDATLATRSITLQLDGLAHLGTVPLHANTFQRALLNLVHNAMDAMPQGGTLRLRGRREATQVHLDVCDTGTGISPEQCLQIFEPLYTTKPGGTGLGLYIVQEIVTAHGGRIAVHSTLGHGTTFTITLPIEPPLQADAPG